MSRSTNVCVITLPRNVVVCSLPTAAELIRILDQCYTTGESWLMSSDLEDESRPLIIERLGPYDIDLKMVANGKEILTQAEKDERDEQEKRAAEKAAVGKGVDDRPVGDEPSDDQPVGESRGD